MNIEEFILTEEDDFVVINKPSGLLSIPDREGKDISLKNLLIKRCGQIFTVHRLDRNTSGVVVFAKNEEMHRFLSKQFETRETEKIYYGLVLGILDNHKATINEPIAEHPVKRGLMTVFKKGKDSITEYEVLESFKQYSWLQFHILTGRTHQIRVHMKHIGHPIVCDDLYGDGKQIYISQLKKRYKLSKSEESERPILNRLALHSARLKFMGINGEKFQFEAPLPKDLQATLNQLRKTMSK